MLKVLGLSTLGICGFVGYDFSTNEKIILRNLRTMKASATVYYNYKYKVNPENLEQIHEDTAHELYNLCKQNSGLYLKFGQAVAASEHMLPPAYFKWFSQLQDEAQAVDYQTVRSIFKEDVGQYPEDIFSEFEQEPLSSASISQVHRAKLKTGEQVAVKIQKPNIQKQFKNDLFMHKRFWSFLDNAFDLPLAPFHDSVQENLAQEINFKIEAENALKCRQEFNKLKRKDIYVPKIYNQYTSKRTLVLEWIDGIEIIDYKELNKKNFDTKQVLNTTIEAFAEQIFITGFTHADPHPGNLLIRRNPVDKSKQQVVLLDYGLCYQISDEFRQQYCKLWKSLFLQDHDSIDKITKNWGIKDGEVFASFKQMGPLNKDRPVEGQITKQQIYDLQLKFKEDFKVMLENANKFPKDLLYINKNMNLVRRINKRLGSQVNRINLMTKYSVKGYIWFETILMFSSLFYSILQTLFRHFRGKGFEDVLEEEMKRTIQLKYASYGMSPPDESQLIV